MLNKNNSIASFSSVWIYCCFIISLNFGLTTDLIKENEITIASCRPMLPTVTPPEKNMHRSQERTYRKSGDVYLKNRNLTWIHPNLETWRRKTTLIRTELEENRNSNPWKYIICPHSSHSSLLLPYSHHKLELPFEVCSCSDDVQLKSAGERRNWARRHKNIIVTTVFDRNINVGGYILELQVIAPEWKAKLHSIVIVGTRNQELVVMGGDIKFQRWKLWQMFLYVHTLLSCKMRAKG